MMLALPLRRIIPIRSRIKKQSCWNLFLGKQNIESFNNGAIMTQSKTIKHVISSASEAETEAIFYNCEAALPLRVSLKEMGHEQPKTPVTTDNTTAHGLIKNTMIPKHAKSYNMRLNFLKCREAQNQFDLVWRK